MLGAKWSNHCSKISSWGTWAPVFTYDDYGATINVDWPLEPNAEYPTEEPDEAAIEAVWSSPMWSLSSTWSWLPLPLSEEKIKHYDDDCSNGGKEKKGIRDGWRGFCPCSVQGAKICHINDVDWIWIGVILGLWGLEPTICMIPKCGVAIMSPIIMYLSPLNSLGYWNTRHNIHFST